MSRNSLRSSIAVSILVAFAGVAQAQQERGGPGGGSSPGAGAEAPAMRGQGAPHRGEAQKPSSNASDRATGQAPGMRGQADGSGRMNGSERARERTGAGSDDQSSKGGRSTQGNRGGDVDRQRGGDHKDSQRKEGQRDEGQRKQGADRQRGGDHDAGGKAKESAGRINVAPQQRTRIQERIRTVNVRTVPRDRINVNIRIGSRLPRTIDLAPIPTSIVEIVPQFRGYRIIRVGDEILIVEPGTLEIVYVLNL